LLAESFILLRLGAAQKAANDPAKRALLDKKEDLERRIDTLKIQKAAMSAEDYKRLLTDTLVELARVQTELDQ
jgi:3-phenylpropionate/cinnamic acid dioxygenase small subunit